MSRHHDDLLWQSSLRFLLQHPWHFLLSILGVALGVAMVISIDLSNSSAQRAFSLSAEALTGNTHQIHECDFLSDQVYRDLRLTAGIEIQPPLSMAMAGSKDRIAPFRYWVWIRLRRGHFEIFKPGGGIDLAKFITGQPTVIISDQVLTDLAKDIGDSLQVSVGGDLFDLLIAGAIATANKRSQQALESVILVDVNTAQQLFDMDGQLSRIDLIVPEEIEEAILASLSADLPEGSRLVSSVSNIPSQMTRAFELNLQALSLLALLVGMFLIYNTMTFSVVQRLPLMVVFVPLSDKSEVLSMIVKEAVLIGLIGTILGITAGIGFTIPPWAGYTVHQRSLFCAIVLALTIELILVLKAVILGLGATLLAAFGQFARPQKQRFLLCYVALQMNLDWLIACLSLL